MSRARYLIALALVGATPAPQPIAMSVNSWGQLIAAWRIAPDGAIHYEETGASPGQAPPPVPQELRDAPPSPARYAWVVRMLSPARRWAGKELPCRNEITDGAYGELRWGDGASGAVLHFNSGCMDVPTKAVLDRLFTVGEQVARWAKAAPAAHP